MSDLTVTAEQLEKIGQEVVNSFHLVEVKGKYLTDAGFQDLGHIGLMTWLIVSVQTIPNEDLEP